MEDLCNELFYEIFTYLDVYHIYKSFYGLNQRLESLLTNSTVPLTINLSLISKSAFQYYHRQILMPNKHRMTTLRLSHVFIPDLIFSPVRTASDFARLETFIFDHGKSKYLPNILHHLSSLLHLTSIVIIPIDHISKSEELYRAIFRLPVLKYCKISLGARSKLSSPPLISNVTSSIEHLVLDDHFDLHQLDVIFSCVPHLRRLSVQSLSQSNLNLPGNLFASTIDNLREFSVDRMSIPFHQFEQISNSLFTQLEVLHLSINNDREYLDAKQWERVISFGMPKLRIFDFQHSAQIDTDMELNQTLYDSLVEQFSSLFWMKRKWLFAYQRTVGLYRNQVFFYSTNPYR